MGKLVRPTHSVPRDLSRLLKPYEVRSRKVKIAGAVATGHRAAWIYTTHGRDTYRHVQGHLTLPPLPP